MKIHEYQAKEIFRKFDVPVPRGILVTTPEAAKKAAEELGGGLCVVKAQIHAGGRGKGGGVKVAKTPSDAETLAREILDMTLITHQTGPEGKLVNQVLIEEGMDIKEEYYLGIVVDRAIGRPVIMASTEGGMEIEEVAATRPEKILKEAVDPAVGLQAFQLRKIAFALGASGVLVKEIANFVKKLYTVYEKTDCSIAEINPLVITGDGKVLALDAKVNFDDSALYRHKDLLELRDLTEEEPLEIEASKYSLNYIKLDGNIGCMVNGAGLAMATMDIIKLSGGEPANFLDVGGGADEEQVENAFRIILADKNVKVIFINIFGGILRCDKLSTGVVAASKKIGVTIPIVVRMEGTNFEEGRQILHDSGLNFIMADGMKDGAQKAVAALNG